MQWAFAQIEKHAIFHSLSHTFNRFLIIQLCSLVLAFAYTLTGPLGSCKCGNEAHLICLFITTAAAAATKANQPKFAISKPSDLNFSFRCRNLQSTTYFVCEYAREWSLCEAGKVIKAYTCSTALTTSIFNNAIACGCCVLKLSFRN